MAKATKGGSKSSSGAKVKLNSKKSGNGVHAKSKTSSNKRSKNYVKSYKGQGR
jgi:hypothetical protein